MKNFNLAVALGIAIAATAIELSTNPASAANLNFNGGTCQTNFQAAGYQLLNCVNNTGVIVNDIHLVFSNPADGLPNVTINRGPDGIICRIFGGADCFGPDVAAGGKWTPNGIVGITIWDRLQAPAINQNNVRLTGYWTSNGKRIAVPEPNSALSLLALGTLGGALTLKRQIKSSKSNEK